MNLVLLKIAAIPLRLVDLDPGYSQANLRTNTDGRHPEQAAPWRAESWHEPNVGEGRPYKLGHAS